MNAEANSSEHHAASPEKKRRLHGACDACRKKKVKCDSAKMPDNVCTNCRTANVFCAHTIGRHVVKKKDTQANYIRNLEQRLAKMERSLQGVIRLENEPLLEASITTSDETHTPSPSAEGTSVSSPSRYHTPKSILANLDSAKSVSSEDTSEAEDLSHVELARQVNQLSLQGMDERFFGPSSFIMFLLRTSGLRNQASGTLDDVDSKRFRRPIYWEIRPWEMELAASNRPQYYFPDEDLLENLVSLYFEKVNIIYPLLHQPTFRKFLSSRRHLWDTSFGTTVLMVCAIASRYSQDPRVMRPEDPSGLSAGWPWFSQVPVHRNSLLYKSDIHDLQYFVLASVYLISTGVPHAAWTILGFAMRVAQEKGIHRRKGNSQKPTVDAELSKRVFWCLIALDRVKSSFLGRPLLMQDEDFDVEFPIECDDEYWEPEDPEQAFKQPSGKPCKITAFIYSLKLGQILVYTLRTLYATKKSKILSGYAGAEWERLIVSELDSSMNKWKDSLPQFLQWDPSRQQYPFFDQSANIYALYFYLQILIHRPFLSKKCALSFPSLAMCTNAARMCSKVVEAGQHNKCAPYQLIISAFTSGIVIGLNLWGHQKSGMVAHPESELENFNRCRRLLQECEHRFHIAGRFRDLLEATCTFDEHGFSNINNAVPRIPDQFPSNLHQPQLDTSRHTYPTATTIPTVTRPPMFFPAPQSLPPEPRPEHNPDPSSVFPPNTNWDLNNLLLLQMAYSKADNGENMDVYSPDSLYSTGVLAPEDNMIEDMKTMNNNVIGPNLTAEEMIQLWSDIPASFSVDEWDGYISNIGSNTN